MLHMAALNIRNVDDRLVRTLKMEAAAAGTTLRELCIGRLSHAGAERSGAEAVAPARDSGKGCKDCGAVNGLHQRWCKA